MKRRKHGSGAGLTLARKRGERVVIGTGPDRIVVTVCRISRDAVRIGFEADPHIRIWRQEIAPCLTTPTAAAAAAAPPTP